MTILTQVAEKVAGSGTSVRDAVVNELANREIARRTNAVVKGFDLLAEAQKELNKIKPDQVSFNGDGTKAQELWSKAKLEEKKKAEAKIAKITAALDKATADTPDYSGLFNLVGGKGDASTGGNDAQPASE